MGVRRPLEKPLPVVVILGCLLAIVAVLAVCVGRRFEPPSHVMRALLAMFGAAEVLPAPLQTILELRIFRVLTTAGVGASLALSGALLQGMFRNGLAAPSLIGITSGASLGATIAILIVGGYAPNLVMERAAGLPSLLIPAFGFLGAMGAVSLVAILAAPGGRISTPTLLLFGIAVNMCAGGVFAAIQSLVLRDWEVSRSIMAWTFGTLEDRSALHAATVWIGLAISACAIPFVALELDLFKGGEADAESLGVSVTLVKLVCVAAAALSAAAAVAVAGQIAFVGLVVPHIVRMLCGSLHRTLLPITLVAGALFLTGADLAQRAILGEGVLQPGVLMSLIGGPFFVVLLVRHRREVAAW
jgi:iron complex transport system permease protein